MHSLTQQLKHPSELSNQNLLAMFRLFQSYYDACEFAQFKQDLLEKTHVLLLMDADNHAIVGFTTAVVLSFDDGNPFKAIFSGDTIVDRQYWGSQDLLLFWCQCAGEIKRANEHIPLYWFLIVKGHRTYRYLPLFTKRFYPNWRYATPKLIQSRLDAMASRKFGDYYNPYTGIIHFTHSKGHLKQQWATIPNHLQTNPDINYFLQRNPRYYAGDELACITELTDENLKSYALRAFKSEVV